MEVRVMNSAASSSTAAMAAAGLGMFAASALSMLYLNRKPHHHVRCCRRCSVSSVPVIDLMSMSAVEQMRQACMYHGFFYITNHGVNQDLLDEVFRQSKRFFDKPMEFKLALAANEFNKGYTRLHEEQLDNKEQRSGDTKEGFYIGRDVAGPESILEGPNRWPSEDELPDWKDTMLRYYDEMTALGHTICRMLALTCDLSEHYFEPYFKRPLAVLRLLHYTPDRSAPEQGKFAAGAHSDYGMITLLANDKQPGLQINLHGHWVDVPPRENCLVVNLGDMFMRWTNDTYQSTVHRVVNTTGQERYSIPFFFEPDFDAVVECIPTFCRDRPPLYPPVRYGDYLVQRYRETHHDYKA